LDATRNVLELRPLPELFFSAPEKLALLTNLDQQSKLARICREKKVVQGYDIDLLENRPEKSVSDVAFRGLGPKEKTQRHT